MPDHDNPRQPDRRPSRAGTTRDNSSPRMAHAATGPRQPTTGPEPARQNRDRKKRRTDHPSTPNPSPTVAPPEPFHLDGDRNYRVQTDRPANERQSVHIELPDHDPVITPGAAAALLRLIINAAGRSNDNDYPSISRSTR